MKKQLKQKFIKGLLLFFLMYLLPSFSFAQLVELEKASYLKIIESDNFGNVYSVKQSGTYPNDIYQIRKWNGLNFTALTDQNISYFNGNIRRLEFDKNGNLFVVGDFKNSNGQYFVAKWDGNNWSQIGSSQTTFGSVAINSIGEIVVSRFEVNNYGKAAILKWNGSNWSSLIDTATYNFWWGGDLEFDKFDNLYLSGAWDNQLDWGGNPINRYYIAKWNNFNGLQRLGDIGTNNDPYKWDYVGPPTDIEIGPDNSLYVIGKSGSYLSVLRNNGGFWSDLGSGSFNTQFNSQIRFDIKGNLYGSRIGSVYKYDGSIWTSVINLDQANVISIGFDINSNIILTSESSITNIDNSIFKYFTNPPILNNFSPKFAFKGDEVTIYGKNLFGVTSVIFGNDTAQSFQVINDNSLVAIVGNGSSGNIKVVNPAGSSTLSGFVFPAPIIQSFDPIKSAKGAIITIKGLNFRDVQNVTFGEVAAKSFNVINNTTISATVSMGNSGYVSVTTLGGKDSLAGFVFIPSPVISSFAPTSAKVGETVTIIGTNLSDATKVSFGGMTAKSFTILSAGTIQAVLDSGSTGSVSVTTPGGKDSLAGFIFTPTQTGLLELTSKNLQVYPNPAQDNITIQSEMNVIGQSYNIYDCIGKLVLNGAIENQTTPISLQALNNGIYTLVIGTNSRKVIKLVKSSSN